MSEMITGSEALIRALLEEGTDTIFGYPGGAIIPVFDSLYDYKDKINQILVRHEQGATHAAQGYARVSGRIGVVIATSGPGATNLVTGISDAMMDSTPLVVITGQVGSAALGTDAFQETDVIGVTSPITKWSYQIRKAEDIPYAVARAFFIASTGRPGPVVLDFAKDAQCGKMEWHYEKCKFIRSYIPNPRVKSEELHIAAQLINASRKPMIVAGQGVTLAGAEAELAALAEKADIPVTTTLLGLATIPSDHPLNKGMLGMHGNIGANNGTLECDLFIAVGMRFDDRVTGDCASFLPKAKVLHIDIDESEFNKNIKADATVLGDAKAVLKALIARVNTAKHTDWIATFDVANDVEKEKVIRLELFPESGDMKMGEVVDRVSKQAGDAILVTDVGQNQMFATRYFKYYSPRSVVTSGGLGTMGFGLPAAIGAKFGAPERTVCFFTGDGGIQMTVQELGVILEHNLNVKIIILNNNFLGMVRQWQSLFYHDRYSQTPMVNPNFVALAHAYGIEAEDVEHREDLDAAIGRMLSHDGAYILNVKVEEHGLVMPMIPAGKSVKDTMISATEKFYK